MRLSLGPLGVLTIPLVELLLHGLGLGLVVPGRRLARRWLGSFARGGCRGRGWRLRRGGLRRIEISGRGGVCRQFIVMDGNARPRLPTDVSCVGEPFVHEVVLAVESVDAAAGHLLEFHGNSCGEQAGRRKSRNLEPQRSPVPLVDPRPQGCERQTFAPRSTLGVWEWEVLWGAYLLKIRVNSTRGISPGMPPPGRGFASAFQRQAPKPSQPPAWGCGS